MTGKKSSFRQINRDDARADGAAVLQIAGQFPQAVFTPGCQHQVDSLRSEDPSERFADPR
jgi:hypothetical protein